MPHRIIGEIRLGPGRLLTALMLAVAVLVASCSLVDDETTNDDTGGAETTPTRGNGTETAGGPLDVVEIVREIEPSVVSVVVTTSSGGGEGSGVIVRPDGLIVTNFHVVSAAGTDGGRVVVVLADGSRLDATVEAADPRTDLALLRVDRAGLPAARIAQRFPVVGEPVVAFGNALGFENTVTAGIVSGVQRSIPAAAAAGGQALVDLIQVDAAISPGNSGGALVDADGEVLGINVAFIPPTSGAVNLGFAIPAPTVADVIEELLEDGSVDHPFVGVQLSSLTPQIAERFGLDSRTGAVVVAVSQDSPASTADLAPGDVIVAAGGEGIDDVGDFLTRLRRFEPGDALALEVVRNGAEMTVTVTLDERPES